MKELLKNRSVQLGLAVFIGVALGALFYPTKKIEERVKQEYQEKIDVERTAKEILRKQLTEQIDELKEERTVKTIETVKKVAKLTYQIKELRYKKKETFYKLIKPDGTIEIRSFKESEVNESTKVITSIRTEFNQKVTEIEERWKRVHTKRVVKLKKDFDIKEKTYQEKITKLESEKIVDINPKNYGVEIGALSSRQYYFHANMDIFGPVFIGFHTQTNFSTRYAIGAGIGIRF